MSNPDDPLAWVAKADHDLLCILNNLNNPDVPWDIVCFHAQQAAEKMLRALLVARGTVPVPTHDLARLLADVGVLAAPLAHLQPDCDRLTPYAVVSRYPGLWPEPGRTEGSEALAAARRIYAAVRPLLPPGAHP